MKMDARTLRALKSSIRKWERIVNGTGVDRGYKNCPLCRLFNTGQAIPVECVGCPVMEYTGRQYCKGTPYDDWDDSFSRRTMRGVETRGGVTERRAVTKRQQAAARRELKFLRSLLPSSEEK